MTDSQRDSRDAVLAAVPQYARPGVLQAAEQLQAELGYSPKAAAEAAVMRYRRGTL